MKRLPSTLALAGWLGFLLVSALRSAGASLEHILQASEGAFLRIDTAALLGQGNASVVMPLAAAGLLGCALFFLHEARIDRRSLGEGLAYAGLGLVALIATTAGAGVFSIDVSGAVFWALLGGAILAIAFDHLVADEAPDDEEAFRAGIDAIAQAMARQTYLHTAPQGGDSKVPRR